MLAFSLYILKKILCAWFLLFLSIFSFAFQFFMLHFILILLSNQYFFLYAQVFSFLIRFCDLQDTMLYHWSTLLSLTTCVTYCETISDYWSPLSLPIQPLPTEAENFPRVFKHPKHVLLPIYLAYLLPKSTSW